MITEKTDFTDAYKQAWKKHIERIDSKKGYQEHYKEGERFSTLCTEVAGRKLEPHEMKNILHSVSTKKPKFKINKFGQFFGKRVKDDVDYMTKNGADYEIS
jgi:hypothetical protein